MEYFYGGYIADTPVVAYYTIGEKRKITVTRIMTANANIHRRLSHDLMMDTGTAGGARAVKLNDDGLAREEFARLIAQHLEPAPPGSNPPGSEV